MILIDTHCHLDAAEFDADREILIQDAIDHQVKMMVVPAVHRNNFGTVIELSERNVSCAYALGIHPMYVASSESKDLDFLKQTIEKKMQSAHPPVAIGEIGLDYFVTDEDKGLQEYYFVEQLKIDKQF